MEWPKFFFCSKLVSSDDFWIGAGGLDRLKGKPSRPPRLPTSRLDSYSESESNPIAVSENRIEEMRIFPTRKLRRWKIIFDQFHPFLSTLSKTFSFLFLTAWFFTLKQAERSEKKGAELHFKSPASPVCLLRRNGRDLGVGAKGREAFLPPWFPSLLFSHHFHQAKLHIFFQLM